MLKDLGVDISKNNQIDKAVLQVKIDASAGRGIGVWRGAGRIRHIATPTVWVQKSHKTAKSKSRKSLEYRCRQTLEPNNLTADEVGGHWRGVAVTFVEEGLESRCGQKCKKSRDTILKFSLSMHVKLTLSQTRK